MQWVTDQRINSRGVAVDLELVRNAIDLDASVRQKYVAEAVQITGLDNPNSVAKLATWISEETETEVTDLQKGTVTRLLGAGINSDAARRVLEIRQELSKTSNKKYHALIAATGEGERVRGLLQFYGASRTGRWAGRIVQPQNLPRTYIKDAILPLARQLVKDRNEDGLRLVFGSVPDTLSQLIRTAFIAQPGHILVDADFSAIEARVIAWLAGEDWVLDVFRTHGKIYEATASQMFSVPIDRIKKGNPEYAFRQKGKVATLALGYQGGAGSLISMGALDQGLSEDELPDIVIRWRQANPNIVNLWYTVEAAAKQALDTGATVTLQNGRLVFAQECDPQNNLDFLTIRLPNGRKLYYAHPHMGVNRFGKPSICYWGTDQHTKKWGVLETYGGKLAENITQAVARDCLAESIEALEGQCHRVVFHVHDEVVIEATHNTLSEVEEIMSEPPVWADGLPLNADGWANDFFKKE